MNKNVILFGLGSIGLKHLTLIQKEFKNIKLIKFQENLSKYFIVNALNKVNFRNKRNYTPRR